jgi:hypothetical protein
MDEIVLSPQERLHQLEKTIEDNLLAFMIVGKTLIDIRESGLFTADDNPETGESYRLFSEYMHCRWKSAYRYAYCCITGTVIQKYLSAQLRTQLPTSEGQIRPLAKLATVRQVTENKKDPMIWLQAWKDAVKLAGNQVPTDKQVDTAVRAIQKSIKAADLPDPSPWTGQEGIFVGDAMSPDWLESLPKDSFDMVVTDPPWAEESIETYHAAARAALRTLRPGGVCAIYFGKIYLPDVIKAVADYLPYEWMYCYTYHGQIRIRKAAVYDCWRPIGIFRKPGDHEMPPYGPDVLEGKREKGTHPWQQSLDPARELIRRYTKKGSIIFDPFVGGGTFPLAAKLEERRYLSFDINPDTVKLAIKRVDDGNINDIV